MSNKQSSMEASQLPEIERQLREELIVFQRSYIKVTQINSSSRKNSQLILPNFIKLISHSLKPLQLLLRFLTDTDILQTASTCRTLYKLLYSPLGFRITRYLRPPSIQKHQSLQQQIPIFSQTTVDQLCSDRSLQDADEDDKMAIILTMKTNILATKHKVRQLDIIIQAYDRKFQEFRDQLVRIHAEKQEKCLYMGGLYEQIEKLRELLMASQGHVGSLRDEQDRMEMDRQTRMLMLNEEKSKLIRHKELLIKKIKSQQKEKEEGMMYAKQVNRVLTSLNQITMNSIPSKPTKK